MGQIGVAADVGQRPAALQLAEDQILDFRRVGDLPGPAMSDLPGEPIARREAVAVFGDPAADRAFARHALVLADFAQGPAYHQGVDHLVGDLCRIANLAGCGGQPDLTGAPVARGETVDVLLHPFAHRDLARHRVLAAHLAKGAAGAERVKNPLGQLGGVAWRPAAHRSNSAGPERSALAWS